MEWDENDTPIPPDESWTIEDYHEAGMGYEPDRNEEDSPTNPYEENLTGEWKDGVTLGDE
jgi:hypothetical protein